MRISDWSSDVCSSDLAVAHHRRAQPVGIMMQRAQRRALGADMAAAPRIVPVGADGGDAPVIHCHGDPAHPLAQGAGPLMQAIVDRCHRKFLTAKFIRSEEHTSELQSLMRISYAVFCLKKKQKNK